MKRNIITIDEEKCNGCGLCASACHEGALKIINGKAKLISESYCDGLGNCLPECPTGAITIEEREAAAFDEEAVKRNLPAEEKADDVRGNGGPGGTLACGCPSAHARVFDRKRQDVKAAEQTDNVSELRQWPCQIKLVPVKAPYFNGAKLLIAADCTAYANANVHGKYMKGRITLIGCPKLDMVDYAEKLTEIIKNNDIKSVEVLRMSVPCCGGIENAVKQALIDSRKMIPWSVTVISTDGEILE
jgi:ferredoxin